MGGKKGKNASVPAPRESTAESSTNKTISTTMSGFAEQASRNGIILGLGESESPENMDEMRERHNQSRGTASPTESMYQDYVQAVGQASNEATIAAEVNQRLLKLYPKENYGRAFNKAVTGFPENVGFNNGLSTPQPDFVQGLGLKQFRPLPIKDQVDTAVLYKGDSNSITLPHMTGEFKKKGGDMETARQQSAYAGAALSHGRNQALGYMGKPPTAGHANVTSFTTNGINLNLFGHHTTQSEEGTTEYHQCPISSTNLTVSHQEFKKGYKQIRNAQDHAREESYKLRDQLKEHWEARKAIEASSPSAANTAGSRGNKRSGSHRDGRG
ncbi:hypothetical protein N0V84_009411 [Fusarium piperis]|uniref:DUF7924 domain-containing protein n=1 Tax=Fusarium piperis TaxID=1435070 RepID=A0A9W8W6D0_9HYPO|nr:hypothetical protein N0V84_009411 [Fusarium piperis]